MRERPAARIRLKLVGFTRQSYPAVPGPPAYVRVISSKALTARGLPAHSDVRRFLE
jgi:hypothetical protein